ncbi:hypothetical protein AGMMS50262_17400 [Bacteroidia bacterium]|nr:hypothetical protein AGMMS50262_17400 [Bacteroidia bacterium]
MYIVLILKSYIMEKTIKLFFVLCFLVITSLSYAQIKVDSLNRVFFGKAPNISKGFYFTDLASSSGGISSISLIRKSGNGDFVISRSGSTSTGFQLSANTGTVGIGNNLSAMSGNDYTGLQICQTGSGNGIHVKYASSGGYQGVISQVDATSALPFVAYRGGTSTSHRIFHVDGAGIVYSNGTPITSDLSLKNNRVNGWE